ncbi:MAG: fused MFS/spermidine synthase [Proteobacteria bacterium]|nr:fused MFS/spermidine synthase [Pseudomonadota bacterium]
MDELAASLRRERAISALLPLFFVSGATALIYQTLWGRQLHLVFGTSTFAIATVLSAFMAGLALGGFWMARHADTLDRPLLVYGWLEIVIGIYGVCFPFIIKAITPIYLNMWVVVQPTPVVFGLFQYLIVGTALLLPTVCMGATLPILARFATERMGAVGDRVGTLYSINTAGAVFGTWICGFVLLPNFGLWTTTIIAALANVLLGSIAWMLDIWSRGAENAPTEEDLGEQEFFPALIPVGVAIGLAGLASLIYEVAWFRVLGLMLGASVYAFSVMLLAFLVGIAIGGKAGGPLADRVLARFGQVGVIRCLAIIEIGVALLSWLLVFTFHELPFWYVWLFDLLDATSSPTALWAMSLLLAGVVMAPPAVLMGAAFPVAIRAVVGWKESLGGPVGNVYGANTLGAVVGAAVAGFLLLPTIGIQGTVLVGATVNLLAAVVLLVWRCQLRFGLAVAGGFFVLLLVMGFVRPKWDPMLLTAGMYKYVSSFSDHSREGIISYSKDKYKLLYYKEGLATVVTVAENHSSGNIWLANNGKVDASTTTDMPTQVLCTLLPMQFVEQPKDVLVIGLASGITAGAASLVDDIKRLDVVELEPATQEAARFFVDYNHNVLEDPRLNLITNDGRNHVLLSSPGTYDVIVSEPSNPWLTGVSNLFTKEFFEMGKTRLKDGGVWSQWVQLYGMGTRDLKSVLATFASTYDYVLVYATIADADLVLIGSDSPILPTLDNAASLAERWPRVKEQLKDVDAADPLQIVAMYQLGRDRIVEMVGDEPINTDDNMRIEYGAPGHLHDDTGNDNHDLFLANRQIPYEALEMDPFLLFDLAYVYEDRDDRARSIKTMVKAAELLPSEHPLHMEFLEVAGDWAKELLGIEKEEEEDKDGK